jgi:hypothetical protein
MDRDKKNDLAEYLFEQVKPELLKVLRNAPEYGSCGLELVMHEGQITRILVKAEIARKLQPRTGGAG